MSWFDSWAWNQETTISETGGDIVLVEMVEQRICHHSLNAASMQETLKAHKRDRGVDSGARFCLQR